MPEFEMPPEVDPPPRPALCSPATGVAEQPAAYEPTGEGRVERPRPAWRHLLIACLIGVLAGAAVPAAVQGFERSAVAARVDSRRSLASDYLTAIAEQRATTPPRSCRSRAPGAPRRWHPPRCSHRHGRSSRSRCAWCTPAGRGSAREAGERTVDLMAAFMTLDEPGREFFDLQIRVRLDERDPVQWECGDPGAFRGATGPCGQ